MTNREYIKDNFIEKNDLLLQTGIQSNVLHFLIKEKLIPTASYIIELEMKITSSLNDQVKETIREEYFGKNVALQIENFKKDKVNVYHNKTKFKENFKEYLLTHQDRRMAYGNLFDDNSILAESQFEKIVEEEWNHYCNGIYGICTPNATEKEIIEKEIVIKKLIDFDNRKQVLKPGRKQKDELEKLDNHFNRVVRLFAPYQRKEISRGKYLDKLLRENGMDEKIKKYTD